MIDTLIRFSVEKKAVIGLLILGLIAWGLYALSQLPIDAVPDITNNQIQVVTVAPTLAPQEMEQYVTFPVELNMANIPGVTEVRSVSKYGLSVVTVVFEDEVTTLDARQLVNEQIQKVQSDIPAGFGSPEMMPITTGLGEIFQYVLEPQEGFENKFSATELRTIHDWIVKRYLAGIEGIVETSSFGGFVKQYEVSVDPSRLRAMDLTLNEVYAALEANNANTGGSYLERDNQAFYIRTEGLLQSLDEIAQVPIALRNGLPILMRDVAEIREGHLPRFGTMTRNGRGEAVGGITLMLKGANTNTVIAAVKERIKEVEKALPEGLKIVPFLDRAALVQRTIGTVRTNLIEGGLIVVFVLVVLLGNWRAGLVVASVIPLALLFAFGMMHVFGVSANLMSLGAIDFGLIVDGAVILVESVVHRLQSQFSGKTLSRKQMDEEVIGATSRIRSSAAFGELIILMVYLPLLALSGIEGKMFAPMAQTVGFAILGALILSMTYVPMASALFLSRKQTQKRSFADKFIAALQNAYQPILKASLLRPWLVLLVALAAFAGSMLLFSRMGGEFIPQLEEGDLAMQMAVPAGSALSHTVAMSTRAEKILLDAFPEVLQVVSKIGSSEIPTDPMSVEDADIMIIMKEKEAWTTTQDRNELVRMMAESLSPLEAEGVSFEFTQPIELRFNELLTGSKADVAVKIYGDDLSELAQQAENAAKLIRNVDGAADVKVDRTEGFPQVLVRYRRGQMARYGISVEEVNQTIQAAFAGGVAGVVFEGERRFELVVRLQPQSRKAVSDIGNLQMRLADGGQVPIRELADIGYAEGPMQISRDDTKRQITIGVNVRDRDLESVVADIQAKLETDLALPPGYALRYGGEFENLESARKRLLITVPIVLFLILVMLYFTFGSLVQALLIFSAIPMAAIGGVLGLWLRDMPFSISAGVGFIALFGVAVLNGIVLIAYFNQLRDEAEIGLKERIMKGARVRMRPVLMTAAVASLGFLPMAISNSAGAEVQRPLATVVIGGLLTATLLTLLVLPALYYLIEKPKSSPKMKSALGILLMMFVGHGLSAQTNQLTLSLIEAEEMMRSEHPELQIALKTSAQEKLGKNTSWQVDPLKLQYQRGQMNTVAQDNYLGITQDLGRPWLAWAERNTWQSRYELAQLREASLERELRYRLRETWYQWQAANAQITLIEEQIASLREVQSLVKVRVDAGAENQVASLQIALNLQSLLEQQLALQLALEDANLAFQRALGWQEDALPQANPLLAISLVVDTSLEALTRHPLLFEFEAETGLVQTLNQSEKAKYSPGFQIGYFRQSIDLQSGFDGLSLGLSVPLLFKAQRAKQQLVAIEGSKTEIENEWQRQQIRQEIDNLRAKVRNIKLQLEVFEQQSLPMARQLRETTLFQYRQGAINYLPVQQAILADLAIRERYLKAVAQWNETVNRLNYWLDV